MISTRTPAKVCARLAMGFFVMLLVWISIVSVIQIAITYFAPQLVSNTWVIWLMNHAPLYGIAVPVFLLIIKGIPNGPKDLRPATKITPLQIALFIVFCFGVTYLFNFIALFIQLMLRMLVVGTISMPSGPLDQFVANSSWIATLIFGVFVPAFGEEFIFRYVVRKKMRGCADSTYIFFSGLVFALFHGNLAQSMYAFVLGAAFAWIYIYTKSIWVPIGLHFVVNLVGIVLIPAMATNLTLSLISTVFVYAVIPAAIFIYVKNRRWIKLTLHQPSEQGWPKSVRRHKLQEPYYGKQQYTPPHGGLNTPPYAQAAVQPHQSYTEAPPQPQASPIYEPQQTSPPEAPMYEPQQPPPPQPQYAPPPYIAQPEYITRPNGNGPIDICIKNAGMVLYITLAGMMIITSLVASVLLVA